jgi:hypothetical protein
MTRGRGFLEAGRATVTSDAGGFRAELTTAVPFAPGQSARFIVRPEKILLSPAANAGAGKVCMAVDVEDRTYQGVSTVWTVRNRGGERLSCVAR